VALTQAEEVVLVDHSGALLPVGLIGPAAVVGRAGLSRTGRDQRHLGAREPGDHDGGLPRSSRHFLPSGAGSSGDDPTPTGAGANGPYFATLARLGRP
jgi:hypothetical protein